MLKLAKVGANDVVYDLGSGDGRIPITAARTYGARGVGIDIDPQRIKEATENLKAAGVGDKVRFMNQDLFTTNISEATVVTLYLLPSLNLKVLPKLNAELKPGTRIVSHAFDMGDIKPQQTMNVNGRTIYIWTVPDQVRRLRPGTGGRGGFHCLLAPCPSLPSPTLTPNFRSSTLDPVCHALEPGP